MGAFTSVTVVGTADTGSLKKTIVTAVGPASYDSGGSVIDVSTTALGMAAGFAIVHGATVIAHAGTTPATTCTYTARYIADTAGAAATGKLYVALDIQATPAEASGSLTALTFTLEVIGR